MNRFRFNTHRFNAIGIARIVSPFPIDITLEILQDYGIQVSEVSEYKIVIVYSEDYIAVIEG